MRLQQASAPTNHHTLHYLKFLLDKWKTIFLHAIFSFVSFPKEILLLWCMRQVVFNQKLGICNFNHLCGLLLKTALPSSIIEIGFSINLHCLRVYLCLKSVVTYKKKCQYFLLVVVFGAMIWDVSSYLLKTTITGCLAF